MPVRVNSIEIKDFGCVRHRVLEIGPDGVEIKGPSGSGKTSIGDAIVTTLVGKGISKNCIRVGADRSEVLVHCDGDAMPPFTARRIIPRDGQTKVTARNDEGDTRPWQSAGEKLYGIFGSLFDPSRFLAEDKAEQVKMVAGLYPMPVTAEDLERWTGEKLKPEDGKHGLEVVDAVRARFYAQRTDAKKALKETEAAAALARDEAERLAKPEHHGVAVPAVGEEDAPVRAAEGELAALRRRKSDAEAQAARTQGTRDRIVKLREEYEATLSAAPEVPVAEWDSARQAVEDQDAAVERMERELAEAKRVQTTLRTVLDEIEKRQKACSEATAKAARMYDQARDLEETLAETAIAAPTDAEITVAAADVDLARLHADLVRETRAAGAAMSKMVALADEVAVAKREVERLDGVVERLTKDAPAELVTRAKAIPGLAVVDGQIFLDGVAFDRCGGAERRHFAVELAKRSNPEGRLIKMDEVGTMDDKTRVALYEEIVAAGFAVIALRPWCDPEKDLIEPVVVPIREAIEEVRSPKRLTIVMPQEQG